MNLIKIKISKTLLLIISISIVVIVFALIINKVKNQIIINKAKTGYEIIQTSYQASLKKEKYVWDKKTTKTSQFGNKLAKYLPTEKNCEYDNDGICYPRYVNFRNKYKDETQLYIYNFYKIKLKNGMTVLTKVVSPDCSMLRGRCATVMIDINGAKGPNTFGEDIYDFIVTKDQVNLYPMQADHVERCINGPGLGCADYMFKYNTRNYKKYIKNLGE